jgi:uncharacterized membrane protein
MDRRVPGGKNPGVPSRRPAFLRRPPAGSKVAACFLTGAACTAVVWQFIRPAPALLMGWDIAALIYLVMVWGAIYRKSAAVTARLAGEEDPSSPVAELVAVVASVAALVAVGFALVRAGQATGGTKAMLIALGTVSVAVSWLVVHTVYVLRYARTYYAAPEGGINFHEEERPDYLDFAYFAFTVGMTFQVSDTDISKKGIRRLTLHHALLSYVFGAVILATAINVFATLLK